MLTHHTSLIAYNIAIAYMCIWIFRQTNFRNWPFFTGKSKIRIILKRPSQVFKVLLWLMFCIVLLKTLKKKPTMIKFVIFVKLCLVYFFSLKISDKFFSYYRTIYITNNIFVLIFWLFLLKVSNLKSSSMHTFEKMSNFTIVMSTYLLITTQQ